MQNILFSISYQQVMSSHFPRNRVQPIQLVLQKQMSQEMKASSFLLAFTSEQMLYGMEYPFNQFGSVVLAIYALSQDLAHLHLLLRVECQRDSNNALPVLLSRSQNIGVL